MTLINITKKGVDLTVCAYCSTKIDEMSRTVDHLYPKSRGGVLSNKNKVPACKDCNQLKGDLSITEFERALNSLIQFEVTNHRKQLGHLKKVRFNVKQILTNNK
jgi:5-methylcytosine-specific restriction endonuclease McrA